MMRFLRIALIGFAITAASVHLAVAAEDMSVPKGDGGAVRMANNPAGTNAFAFYTAREGMIEALDYKGNSYNATFPPCNHPEHHVV